MKDFEQRVLERMPSPEEERAVLGRVWNQVERAGGQVPDEVLRSVQQRLPARHQRVWTFVPKAVAAVLVLGAAIGTAIVWPRGVQAYAAGNDGLQVTLSDNSRVEMRAHAEMTVGQAPDGIQIDLKTGDIIVTAARQRDGHLYVRTNDMTVAVEGTAFLANAGQQGSRVGVIEGEVRVRERGTPLPVSVETRLRPGEQVATSPTITQRLLAEDITWSRNADAHLAILESFKRGIAQTSGPPSPVVPTGERQQGTGAASSAAVEFEEASIRTCDPDNLPPPPAGARGGRRNSFYMTPGRTYALCVTLATLIRTAYLDTMAEDRPSQINPERPPQGMRTDVVYGLGVEDGRLVRGGPDWIRSELYTIEAVAGGPADAQTMRRPMMRALLARRFGLRVHIETEQIPAFELTVAPGGHKMQEGRCTLSETPLRVGDPGRFDRVLKAFAAIRRGEIPTGLCGSRSQLLNGPNVVDVGVAINSPLSNTVRGAPIVDRTGIPATARFNFVLEYAPDQPPRGGWQIASDPSTVPRAPDYFTALEEQLGLKLTPTRAPNDFVMIDQVERPGPN